MRRSEKGYTLIELIVAVAIIVLVSGAASITIFQVSKGTETNNSHMNAVRQVQNAGYWISRDAGMAQSIETDNLTPPDFLVFNWTEWDSEDEEIYHSATYYIEDLTNGIGKLKRSHWSSAGANEQTLIAQHIYYTPGDPDNTSKADYQAPVLTLQLASLVYDTREIREYRILLMPPACIGLSIQSIDPHFPHQCPYMPAANPISHLLQHVSKHPASGKWILEV